MRFGLRCIFFLVIVYGAILRQEGRLPELVLPERIARVLPAARATAATGLAAGIDTLCRRDPSTCLVEATRLSRLLSPGSADAAVATPGFGGRRARGAITPLLP